jgi:putative acetyltransferase
MELDAHLAVINGTQNEFFAQYNKIDKIDHVVVAYEEAIPVGCGAMKEYEKDAMEIKRMFVPVEMRAKGIASNVLSELEKWAKELNYSKTVLETSEQLTPAIGLYKKSGYKIIPNYGQYENVATSVCFEKILK